MRLSVLPLIAVSMLQVSLGDPEQSLSGGVVSAGAGASQEDGISICCAWGRALDDGELTIAFTPGDPAAIDVMRAAVHAWDMALPELAFRETAPGQRADITISHAAPSNQTRGTAVASYDREGPHPQGPHRSLRRRDSGQCRSPRAGHEARTGPRPRPGPLGVGRRPDVPAGGSHIGAGPAVQPDRRSGGQSVEAARAFERAPAARTTGRLVWDAGP